MHFTKTSLLSILSTNKFPLYELLLSRKFWHQWTTHEAKIYCWPSFGWESQAARANASRGQAWVPWLLPDCVSPAVPRRQEVPAGQFPWQLSTKHSWNTTASLLPKDSEWLLNLACQMVFTEGTPVFSTLWWPHTGDMEGYSRLRSELLENMLPLRQVTLHSLQLSYSPRLTNQYCIFLLSLDETATSVPPCLTSTNDRRWFWATTWA